MLAEVSLTREMYLASCELHIQTLKFLILLTLKQYVNETIWGSEVRYINRHDDYWQALATLRASTPAHSLSFPGEVGWVRTGSAFNPLGLHSLVYILIPVCNPRSVFYTDRDRITTLLCQILIDKKLIGKVLCNIFSYISPQIHSTFNYYLVH